jgi:TRAP-type C4-dicarboxylate transport system substrate-binding protein
MTSFALVMNHDSWNRLSTDQKALVEKLTGAEIAKRMNDAWDSIVAKGMQLMAAPGKEVITLAPAEAEKFNAAAKTALDNYVADLSKRGIKGGELLERLRKQ